MRQLILLGGTKCEVEAVAGEDYVLIGWSDGAKTARRKDKNIKKEMTVYAQFEKVRYAVKYTAGVGGKIAGGGAADAVTAMVNPGYRFVKWSDGVTTATRRDETIIRYFQVWVIFEPIE